MHGQVILSSMRASLCSFRAAMTAFSLLRGLRCINS